MNKKTVQCLAMVTGAALLCAGSWFLGSQAGGDTKGVSASNGNSKGGKTVVELAIATPKGNVEISETEVDAVLRTFRNNARNYLIDEAINDLFYKDIVVNDSEFKEFKDQYIAERFGSEEEFLKQAEETSQSLESFDKAIKIQLKAKKYKDSLKEKVQVDDEKLKEYYEEDKDGFDYVAVNIAIVDTKEAAEELKKRAIDENKHLLELDDLGEVFESQMMPLKETVSGTDFSQNKVGDFVIKQIVDKWYVTEITDICNSFEKCKEFVNRVYREEKAEEASNEALDFFYGQVEVVDAKELAEKEAAREKAK